MKAIILLGIATLLIHNVFSVQINFPSLTLRLRARLGHAPYHIYNANLILTGYFLAPAGGPLMAGNVHQFDNEIIVPQDANPRNVRIDLPAVTEEVLPEVPVVARWVTLLMRLTYEYDYQTYTQQMGMLFAVHIGQDTEHNRHRWHVTLETRRRGLAFEWPAPAGRLVDVTLPRRLQLRGPTENVQEFDYEPNNPLAPLTFRVDRWNFGIVPNAGILADITQLSIGQI